MISVQRTYDRRILIFQNFLPIVHFSKGTSHLRATEKPCDCLKMPHHNHFFVMTAITVAYLLSDGLTVQMLHAVQIKHGAICTDAGENGQSYNLGL